VKRVTIYLLFVLLGISNVYAEVTRKSTLNPDGTVEYIFYSGEKEVAKQISDEDENIVKTVGRIPDGTVKEYYETGKLKAECNYKSGKLDGICKIYFENGDLMSKNNYKGGKRDGITKSYYRGTRLRYKYEYKSGKLDGTVKKYYKSGNLAFEWRYKDGKREGTAKSYFENRSLKAKWNFKGDQLDGITRIYYKNGGIKYIDTYRDGYKTNRKAYDSRGKLEFDQDYPMEKKEKNGGEE
jgi:antitoxin component YwqK of YwqJK toxin-antitoxin module